MSNIKQTVYYLWTSIVDITVMEKYKITTLLKYGSVNKIQANQTNLMN